MTLDAALTTTAGAGGMVRSVRDLCSDGVLHVEDGNHGEYRPLQHEFVQSGVPFVRPDDLVAGRVRFAGCDRINAEARARVRKGIGRGGDVLLTHRATVGRMAITDEEAPEFVTNPGVTVWRSLAPDVLDRRYLFYYMSSFPFQEQLRRAAGDTDIFPYVSLTQQRGLKVALPLITTQRAIAAILGALDDKIELNRKMNETLEQMAQAIFKSWFIDFDGHTEFEVSELGRIPKGWRPATLGELTDKIGSGATPKGGSSVYVQEGAALIRSQNVHDHSFRWGGLVRIDPMSAERLRSVSVSRGDVLINITGDSILRTCVVPTEVLPARVNQHVAIVRPAKGVPARYISLTLLQASSKATLLSMDAGGTRKAITKGHLERFKLMKPSADLLERFDSIVNSLYGRIDHNETESRTLGELRDTLLPKLISGELRIKDAEKLASKVV